MKKVIAQTGGLMVLLMCLLGLSGKAFAASNTVNVTIRVVIDNAAQYPAECARLSSKYSVTGIYQMAYNSTYGNRPTTAKEEQFTVANGAANTVAFSRENVGGRYRSCESLWFQANGYTDSHLSLTSLEYSAKDNLGSYSYSPTGQESNPYTVQPFNWARIIDPSAGRAGVTLHFRYNPEIDQVEPDPDPEPQYGKKIDYLGDGAANPDTAANGVNDYRLYLDMTTQTAQKSNRADIIFVLDTSGSMKESLDGSTRMSVLKSTMQDSINSLTQNPDNRISIIQFASESNVLVSNSTNRQELIDCVSGLEAVGGTNYYSSFLDTMQEINKMTASDRQDREKVVIFISDGEPTFASPAAVTTTNNYYSGMVYACEAIRQLRNTDRLYSLFIGDDTGSASTLQTITQMADVNIEKYMVQARSAAQVTNTLARFMAKMSNSLYRVTLSDELSKYVEYAGGMKVTRSVSGAAPVTLIAGMDYSVRAGTDTVAVTLNNTTTADSRYTMSFNVHSSAAALDYLEKDETFPDKGDGNTDYPGNATSSGRPGFYSNAQAKLIYSFGSNGSAERIYGKPVVQAVEPDAVPAEIKVRKVLEGKTLEKGMFSFELLKVDEGGRETRVATAANGADGFVAFGAVRFQSPGAYTFHIRELVPSSPEQGMTYDTHVLEVKVLVTRDGDDLKVDIQYPENPFFVNTYQPQPVKVTLAGKKSLSGRQLTAGMFSFRLLTNNNVLLETVQNQANGAIRFSPLTFTKAGDYVYLIRESVPEAASENIVYDLKTVTAKITVTDQDGRLKADVAYTPDEVFRNSFVYTAASATIELKKVLTGMQLATGMFDFELKDLSTGQTMTQTNLASGKIKFDLSYSSPGTHRYQVRELIPDDPIPHMTYDEKTIPVTVEVKDDGSGRLTARAEYPENAVFYNSYKVMGGIW